MVKHEIDQYPFGVRHASTSTPCCVRSLNAYLVHTMALERLQNSCMATLFHTEDTELVGGLRRGKVLADGICRLGLVPWSFVCFVCVSDFNC